MKSSEGLVLPRATGNSFQDAALWLWRSRYQDYGRENRHLAHAPSRIHTREASAPSQWVGEKRVRKDREQRGLYESVLKSFLSPGKNLRGGQVRSKGLLDPGVFFLAGELIND